METTMIKEMKWIEFINQFTNRNSEFIERLDKAHPTLTRTQFKVCLYLYSGYSSKDIAEQLNLTKQSVENHRYRLRKKFHLNKLQNLMTYLLRI